MFLRKTSEEELCVIPGIQVNAFYRLPISACISVAAVAGLIKHK
jgi:hypothetical protein